jgi:serpin B
MIEPRPASSNQAGKSPWSASLSMAKLDYGTIVKLPYAGGALAMIVVMPEARAGLPALAARLSGEQLDSALAALAPAKAELLLPRFTLETASHSLAATLIALGMKSPFGAGADLTGISPDLRGDSIQDVIHGARVEVDEHGTVAAASTAVIIGKSTPQRIAIDAPFWLFVRDEQTGLVLFAGQVVDPIAS